MVRKICASLLLVLIVCSLVMSTFAILSDQAFASSLCINANRDCPWHPGWLGFTDNQNCCCEDVYQFRPTCI
jgi:hypothetical protein